MMAIAEDSMFGSRLQEILETGPMQLPTDGPTMLTDYLFWGNNNDAQNITMLQKLGITHIINCAGKSIDNSAIYANHPNIWVHHAFPADDHDNYDMLQHFPETQMIIEHAWKYDGKVLIHCEMGINRSGVLCVAHIMLQFQEDLLSVFMKMKQTRGICVVNTGFQRQLIQFARHHSLLHGHEEKTVNRQTKKYGFSLRDRVM